MLVVHMDSGLGNQMLDYAEYLAIQKANPDQECYIENLVYELPQETGMFSIWNGYELENVFDIHLPNVRGLFDAEVWQDILKKIAKSKFWEEGWNFSPYIVNAFGDAGFALRNYGRVATTDRKESARWNDKCRYALTRFFRTDIGYSVKRYARSFLADYLVKNENKKYNVFQNYPNNSFVGHSLKLKYKGFGIERIEEELRTAFCFPEIKNERNLEILRKIKGTNSVAIHARRSDLLFLNGHCYEHGYFKRAVRYIKRHVENPVFFFFTDEYSIGWCEENEEIFGLNFDKDFVHFVTWNKGKDSYIDMQLMAECKHNIFTESTFGFWGAYLNRNPNKITCAPDVTILATNSF